MYLVIIRYVYLWPLLTQYNSDQFCNGASQMAIYVLLMTISGRHCIIKLMVQYELLWLTVTKNIKVVSRISSMKELVSIKSELRKFVQESFKYIRLCHVWHSKIRLDKFDLKWHIMVQYYSVQIWSNMFIFAPVLPILSNFGKFWSLVRLRSRCNVIATVDKNGP